VSWGFSGVLEGGLGERGIGMVVARRIRPGSGRNSVK